MVILPTAALPSADDPFFHMRFAEIAREHGLLKTLADFKWLFFSKITTGDYFVYYNFPFYVAVYPFTYIDPLYMGADLFGIICLSLTIALFYGFIKAWGVRYSFLWTISFVAIFDWVRIWRFLPARPYTLGPILLVALIFLFHRKRYYSAAALSLFYALWHSATFFFPLCVAFTYFAFEQIYTRRYAWRVLVYPFLGIAAAVTLYYVTAPGFFLYMKDIIFGILSDKLSGDALSSLNGSELIPPNFFDLLARDVPVMVLLLIAVVAEVRSYVDFKRGEKELALSSDPSMRAVRTTFFFLSLAFFLGSLINGRFLDFFTVVGGIYIVLMGDALLRGITFADKRLRTAALIGACLAITYLFVGNVTAIRGSIVNRESDAFIAPAASWLSAHAKPGEVVFNVSWNLFPRLFYYDPANYYIAGLAPSFLYDYSPSLYWEWRHITEDGYVCATEVCDALQATQDISGHNTKLAAVWYKDQGQAIAKAIRGDFKSRFIFTTSSSQYLNGVLEHNTDFKRAYSDLEYAVYEIVAVK